MISSNSDAILRMAVKVAVTAEATDNAYRIFESLNYTRQTADAN